MSLQPNHQTDQKLITKKNQNPYESRYGPDCHIEVKKSSFIRLYAYASGMIEHMVSETNRVFKGTTHKKYCLFYYDALSLMTAKETCKWMKYREYK